MVLVILEDGNTNITTCEAVKKLLCVIISEVIITMIDAVNSRIRNLNEKWERVMGQGDGH